MEVLMNQETLFHIIALVTTISGFSVSVFYRRRAEQTGEEISAKEEGAIILNLRRVLGLLLWLSLLAYLINPGWMAWARMPVPMWLRWIGAGLMVIAVPLIYWVFSSLGTNVTPTVVTREAHSLVTHGPYRWVRHPLYTVGFTLFLGFSLMAPSWFTLIVMLLGSAVLAQRTEIEEARLIERFGDDYRVYMQRTGKFFPRLSA